MNQISVIFLRFIVDPCLHMADQYDLVLPVPFLVTRWLILQTGVILPRPSMKCGMRYNLIITSSTCMLQRRDQVALGHYHPNTFVQKPPKYICTKTRDRASIFLHWGGLPVLAGVFSHIIICPWKTGKFWGKKCPKT